MGLPEEWDSAQTEKKLQSGPDRVEPQLQELDVRYKKR